MKELDGPEADEGVIVVQPPSLPYYISPALDKGAFSLYSSMEGFDGCGVVAVVQRALADAQLSERQGLYKMAVGGIMMYGNDVVLRVTPRGLLDLSTAGHVKLIRIGGLPDAGDNGLPRTHCEARWVWNSFPEKIEEAVVREMGDELGIPPTSYEYFIDPYSVLVNGPGRQVMALFAAQATEDPRQFLAGASESGDVVLVPWQRLVIDTNLNFERVRERYSNRLLAVLLGWNGWLCTGRRKVFATAASCLATGLECVRRGDMENALRYLCWYEASMSRYGDGGKWRRVEGELLQGLKKGTLSSEEYRIRLGDVN